MFIKVCHRHLACVLLQVSEFGLSRALHQGQTYKITRTMGTLTYMPPELLRAGKLSAAGDVYAFGIMSEWGQPRSQVLHYSWTLPEGVLYA